MTGPAGGEQGAEASALAAEEGESGRFAAFLEGFEAARHAVGAVDRDFVIAGYRVRVQFAGEAMVPLITSALAHLAAHAPGVPALTVRVWDSASTGVRLGEAVGPLEHYLLSQRDIRLPGRRIYASFRRPEFGLVMLDTDANSAIYWVPDAVTFPDARDVPFFGWASPLRGVFNWWMGVHGRQFVHAGAVGNADGGVLLVGPSGSGKSTSALACLQAGMDFVGEDFCIIPTEGPPFVYSLYNSAKLDAAKLDAGTSPITLDFPPARMEWHKHIFFLWERYPRQVVSGLPLRAVVAPMVTGADSPTLRPHPRAAVFAALAPSSILQVPGTQAGALRAMARVVSALPCYALELGSRADLIPGVVAGLLADLRGGPK